MAIVVLPVLRSPMISSRWPRPIGVIASIDLMPVCSGSCTGLRPMIPGAWISIRRGCVPTEVAAAVDRLAEGVDTRPSTPSPTGTERMRPVALTVWPSSMSSTSPSTTAPIDDSSRLRARPTGAVLELEQLVDGGVGQARDAGDAVADLVTRPTVRASSEGSKPSRFLLERGGDVGGGEGEFSHAMSFHAFPGGPIRAGSSVGRGGCARCRR